LVPAKILRPFWAETRLEMAMPRGKNRKIIGGMFELQVGHVDQIILPTFLQGNHILTINARSAFFLAAKVLAPKTIWFPSYLCDVMIEAANLLPCDIRFFEIGQDLSVTNLNWISNVSAGDLVIFIDYFGFPADNELIVECQRKKAFVLQDASQALLTSTLSLADFIIFSPRKYLGVPDGGVLKINSELDLSHVIIAPPPAKWFLSMLETSISRRMFDLGVGDQRWFALFQKYEREAPVGFYGMSELSKEMLYNSFDYPSIMHKRRENYAYLSKRLGEIALLPGAIPDGEAPLGFPVILEDRDVIRAGLIVEEIFPPIHWDISSVVPTQFRASHKLSQMIMTLPCDQRYDLLDMERICTSLIPLVSKLNP
jgi:hypothetical protein